MPYIAGRRCLTDEEYFLLEDGGYKYTLKEKPDLANLVVLAKRDRSKKRSSYAWAVILSLLLMPIGLILLIYVIIAMNNIDSNNEANYECVYYDPEKKTIIFRTIEQKLWLEFPIDRVKDISYKDTKDLFGPIVNIAASDSDEEDYFYFKVGYATKEEKLACSEKIQNIKKGE